MSGGDNNHLSFRLCYRDSWIDGCCITATAIHTHTHTRSNKHKLTFCHRVVGCPRTNAHLATTWLYGKIKMSPIDRADSAYLIQNTMILLLLLYEHVYVGTLMAWYCEMLVAAAIAATAQSNLNNCLVSKSFILVHSRFSTRFDPHSTCCKRGRAFARQPIDLQLNIYNN